MSEIKPNQDFKHDRKSYRKGRKYEVDPADAEYFQSVGWVGDGSTASNEASLDIQDVHLGHTSEVN